MYLYLLLLLLLGTSTAHSATKDDVGLTALEVRLGGAAPAAGGTPDGAGIKKALVEAGLDYLPNTGAGSLNHMTYNDRTMGSAGISGHASASANRFFGIGINGIASGASEVDLYSANDWIAAPFSGSGSGTFLRLYQPLMPLDEEAIYGLSQVQSHSWVGNFNSGSAIHRQNSRNQTLRRIDAFIDRNPATIVMAMSNGPVTPDIGANAYNVIAVGTSNGVQGSGSTSQEVTGRVLPHVVVPVPTTSAATPTVAGAAALLIHSAKENLSIFQETSVKGFTTDGGLRTVSNAEEPETVKALILAGATKGEFGGAWDNTPDAQPLDLVYGAGELHIDRSHFILEQGEQSHSSPGDVGSTGWNYDGTITQGDTHVYHFSSQGQLNAALVWNRQIDNPGTHDLMFDVYDPDTDTTTTQNVTVAHLDPVLANLDLRLYHVAGATLDTNTDTLIQQSISTIDNIEYIFQNNLASGRYALEVTAVSGSQEYALAWLTVPEPGAASLLLVSLLGLTQGSRLRA